ncbi:hypothetical protein B0H12DRAFT_1097076 [Mycena haematopus]|nr:hypothetical protein B0H12DRAFT_1097076 [Mycena haematopus]
MGVKGVRAVQRAVRRVWWRVQRMRRRKHAHRCGQYHRQVSVYAAMRRVRWRIWGCGTSGIARTIRGDVVRAVAVKTRNNSPVVSSTGLACGEE